MNVFHAYIYFSEIPDAIINSKDQAQEYLDHLLNTIDRADCEKGSKLYLDRNSVDRLFENLNALNDLLGDVGTLSRTEALRYLIFDTVSVYWDDNCLHNDGLGDKYYHRIEPTSGQLLDGCDPILKEVAERMDSIQDHLDEKCILIDIGGDLTPQLFVSVMKGGRLQLPKVLNVPIIKDFVDLDIWIEKNISIRHFNFGDFRHCEDHPNYIHGKSPLMGGRGYMDSAARILLTAIGDKRSVKYLIHFDTVHTRYIRFEFENENPQNQFHGYHLVKIPNYYPDLIAIGQIPERIINLLKYRQHTIQN